MCSNIRAKAGLDLDLVRETEIGSVEEKRWWFPAGSIVQFGQGPFRWESVSSPSLDSPVMQIISGDFEIRDGIGVVGDMIGESTVEVDPSAGWYENLPEFPHCHFFYYEGMESSDDFGPWFCLDGIFRNSLEAVRADCEAREDEVEESACSS